MPSSKSESPSGGTLPAMWDRLPAEILAYPVVFFLIFCAAALIFALYNMPDFFRNLASMPSKEQCWELKEINGSLFKFNRCTGSFSQAIAEATPSLSPSPPSKAASAASVAAR